MIARGGVLGLAVAVSVLGLARPLPAADFEPAYHLTTTLESDTAWRVRSPRQAQKSQNELALDLEVQLSPSLGFRVKGRSIYDPAGRLVGSDPGAGYDPVERAQLGASQKLEAELREAYLDWHTAHLDVRLGKQQIVWGQSLGLRVLDMVNAQDFREFILDDFVDARIPTFALRTDAFVRGVSVQALVVPDFESDRLPDLESEFALDPALPGLVPGLDSLPGTAPLYALNPEHGLHDWRFETLGYGVRVASFWRGFDWSLHYWDRLDPSPVFRRTVSTVVLPGIGAVPFNQLDQDHARVRTVGFSFAGARDSLALWGEGGVSFGRAYAVDDLADADGFIERNDLQLALGVDWDGPSRLFGNLQWMHQQVFNHSSRIQLDRTRDYASVLVRYDWADETVSAQLFALYGLNEREAMLRPSVQWRVTDRLALEAGLDVFTGPREGLFGQYANERSCVPIPAAFPLPGAGTCGFESPPGRASRAFFRVRYAFELGS